MKSRYFAVFLFLLVTTPFLFKTAKVFGQDTQKSEAIHAQASEAWKKGDYREAMRFYREEQAIKDSPEIRAVISKAEAAIAWGDARSSGDYRHAIAMNPGAFSEDNIRYVEKMEAYEKQIAEHAEARYATSKRGGGVTN